MKIYVVMGEEDDMYGLFCGAFTTFELALAEARDRCSWLGTPLYISEPILRSESTEDDRTWDVAALIHEGQRVGMDVENYTIFEIELDA